jgi:hypothetical protein
MVTILVPWAIAVATYHPSEVSAIGRIEGLTSGARFRAGRPKEWIVFWALRVCGFCSPDGARRAGSLGEHEPSAVPVFSAGPISRLLSTITKPHSDQR